jgi:predicted transcriptional regulator
MTPWQTQIGLLCAHPIKPWNTPEEVERPVYQRRDRYEGRKRGDHMREIRAANTEAILDYIKEHPDCTYAEIVEATGISYSTTKEIVGEMVDLGQVVGEKRGPGNRQFWRAA